MCEQPVAKLNEYMVKLGITPKYEVIDIKIGTHINKFLGRVESPIICNGPIYTAESLGLSKKEAKRQAAANFIHKYLGDTNNNPLSIIPKLNSSFPCCVNVKENNRNSVLQILCSRYNLPNPEFNELGSTGPPHAKHFTFECKISPLVVRGTGSTKAEAKLQATTKMTQLLMERAEVYEIFESPYSTVANDREIICLSNNLKGPQLPMSVGIFGRRLSSTISEFSCPLSDGLKTVNSPSLAIKVDNNPTKVECVVGNSVSLTSDMSLIDLNKDSQPKILALDKARSKSMTNLLDNNISKTFRESGDLRRAKMIRNIDTTFEKVEKELYDEILNTLPNREVPCKRSVMVLDHEFEVRINHGSHAKILVEDQQCTNPSIRIAALTKLLMDMKNYIATSGVEKFNE